VRHVGCEIASFHTPGHKGRKPANSAICPELTSRQMDLTELPGLDELSNPCGVLADLEQRAACLWGAKESIVSVNGASAALAATMIALANRGSTVLLPRNAHRSVIHGLVLSGLFPVWYEPIWDDDWQIWGPVSATSAERLLQRYGSELAGLIVVSPTYAGALSDIGPIADLCRNLDLPLIVDAAHGAHLLPDSPMPESALEAGADIVVHSLHKTLSALTQTGLVHVGKSSLIDTGSLRSAISFLQSSSPSYLLLASIEEALAAVEDEAGKHSLGQLARHSQTVLSELARFPSLQVYETLSGTDPAHILLAPQAVPAERLYNYLCDRGVYPETVLGRGVLLLLGLGTNSCDIDALVTALSDFQESLLEQPAATDFTTGSGLPRRPPEAVQIVSPRQAALMPAELLPVHQAVGRISAETVAPCPPGTSVIVAGQRVPPEILESASLQSLRVVIE